MKKPIGVTIFGIINIILGIIPTTFLIFESIRSSSFIIMIFLFTFAGWVTDSEFACFFDWFQQTIIERGCLIILYISSLFLFWSGLAAIRKKPHARKIAIVSILILFLSWTISLLSTIIRPFLYHKVYLDMDALQVEFVITFSLLIYTLLLVRNFMNPRIKEYFNDANIKFSLKLISWIVLIILIIIFIPILQYLHFRF